MPHINYVELSSAGTARSGIFYSAAFGWKFLDYGPTYAGTEALVTNVGLEVDGTPKPPLPVIEVDDLEAALTKVTSAGGNIVQPIFAFPGGRRFEFTDPDGNRLAVMQAA